jgi:DNA-binding Lrp family transcriptional regulator
MIQTLTKKDRALLNVLQQDATLTLKQLAQRLSMSQASVWRRVQELEAAGMITGRVTLVDPKRLGLSVCSIVQIHLKDHSVDSRAAFERLVTGRPEIMECYSITGAFDYLLIVRAVDVEAYEHFLMHYLLDNPVVATAVSNFSLRQLKYTTALPMD